ncbi:hypothetical protein [Umezawaea sp. Da 62-37]|uniref:hypothetical protein n=1 Tax=Umezawaea sp. Da 62-37 TaxID=3075927 RepID=UPI0028F73ED4|nr:hypothetical protein [Umezawaea sp. Da 62-37]WNV83763.1 hypothetical protein RM788_37135 [Umezawaea sp. Da 62-37]
MTSTLTSPSTLVEDRAALVAEVSALLADKPGLLAAYGTVAVLRGFDRASREARDAITAVVRARGGRVLDLTAASCAGGVQDLPAVDLVVAVSRSAIGTAEQAAGTWGVPLLAVAPL